MVKTWLKLANSSKKLPDRRRRACCILSISSGFHAETSWESWAALQEGTSRDLGFEGTACSLNTQLLWEAAVSSAPWLLLHGCLSPACHAFQAGSALPCGTSLRRGCPPLCCGCFKGFRPVLHSLCSSVASWALGKAQLAFSSASTGSKQDRKPGERNRSLMGFSNSFSLFFYFAV